MSESAYPKTQELVIAGAGLSGWLAASACVLSLGKAVRVTVVGTGDDPEFLTVATASRRFGEFNKLLRLQEDEFMALSGAYFRLGFEAETDEGIARISVGRLGKGLWLTPFYQLWLRAKAAGRTGQLLDYCVESVGASQNKYSVLPNYPAEHGYQFDTRLYTSRLRDLAQDLGVRHIASDIQPGNVEVAEAGIQSLTLSSGEKIYGDIFIDCTGAKALLLGKMSEATRECWREWLPEDRLVAADQSPGQAVALHTLERRNPVGYSFSLSSQRRRLHVQCYSGTRHSLEDALRCLPPESQPGASVRHLRMSPGAFDKMWVKNCVALGAAAAYVDYHEPVQLQLVFRGLLRLLAHFPNSRICSSSAESFNIQMQRELQAMRDAVILRRLMAGKSHSRSKLPNTLLRRIALFEEAGYVECREDDLFKEDYWAQLLLQAGFSPKQLHPVAANMSTAALDELLTKTQEDVRNIVNSLSDHTAAAMRSSHRPPKAPSSQATEWQLPRRPHAGGTACPSRSQVAVKAVGSQKTPVITIEGLGADWSESLIKYACGLSFRPDRNFYPGLRCDLPSHYVLAVMSVIAKLVTDVYQVPGHLKPNIFQSSFSLTTQPEQTLATAQCIPHFDTTKPYSYAILHYLSPGKHGDTGFFRHLPTNLERITEDNRQHYIFEIDRYFASHGQPKKQYMTTGNDHFALIDRIPYQQYKLAIYPSNLIHSAMILPEHDISADPMKGRLTANIFLEFGP